MNFSEKVAMYRQTAGVSADEMSTWLGVSRPTYQKHQGTHSLVPTEHALAQLEAHTNIPSSVWTDDSVDLPTDLANRAKSRGRKPKVVTHDALAVQRLQARRINQLINDYYGGNQRAFAQVIYTDEGRLSRLLINKNEITEKFIFQVANYTGASVRWIRSGEGPVMEKDNPSPEPLTESHNGEQLAAYLRRKNISWTTLQHALGLGSLSSVTGPKGYSNRKYIRPDTKQKIADALKEDVNTLFPQPVDPSIRPYIKEDYETIEIPQLPEYARAGLDAERYFEQPVETVRIRLDDLPMNLRKRRWWNVTVNGDSMESRLQAGDEVIAYWLEREEWQNVHNKVCVVQYANHVVIKRIKKNNLKTDGGLWLHSDNPTAETFFVPVEDLQHIMVVYSVRGNIH